MESNKNKNLIYQFQKDQIFFKEVLFIINKKKSLIFLFVIVTSILGGIYANFKKPTWEGEFQIVLREENNNPNPSKFSDGRGAEIITEITGIDPNMNNIKTEVAILQSQSILRPIYQNFVKKSFKENEQSYISYKKWLKSLDISLKKGTNVLDISYRDKNKENVTLILKKISKAYQDYSGENRRRGLEKSTTYLEDQIKIMNIQSKDSLDKLQSFSLANKIGSFDGLPNPNNLEPQLGSQFIDLKSRISNKNSINPSDLSNDASFNRGDESRLLSQNRFKTQFTLLERLETQSRDLSAFYKPDAPRIQKLEKRIKELKASLQRPKETLIEYRILYRNAMRDERLLNSLEDELSSLNLIKARQLDPWKLISNPTLIDKPVAPNKLVLVSLSLLIGFFSSSLFFIYKSYKSDLILNTFRIKELLPFPLLKNLSNNFKDFWSNDIALLKKNILIDEDNTTINILSLGNLESDNFLLFRDLMKGDKEDIKIIQSNDLVNLDKCNNAILTIVQNETKYDELLYVVESLKISKVNILGWIFIEAV